ncbi:hypothetical protein DPMN_157706 [Dreissena polymorpha]|uniref:Uncharacterized protein n=1 Tax=Dreissena polymorpha TaxID=45954 RepID=A0A9D4EL10_DREPO|nr:hypothetical protein DPMN_157706 [Dreissena polymorpha]
MFRKQSQILHNIGKKLFVNYQNGQSPDDIKRLSAKEKQAFLARERERDFGLDTHLLAKYLDIKEAIRLGDLSLVEQIR